MAVGASVEGRCYRARAYIWNVSVYNQWMWTWLPSWKENFGLKLWKVTYSKLLMVRMIGGAERMMIPRNDCSALGSVYSRLERYSLEERVNTHG